MNTSPNRYTHPVSIVSSYRRHSPTIKKHYRDIPMALPTIKKALSGHTDGTPDHQKSTIGTYRRHSQPSKSTIGTYRRHSRPSKKHYRDIPTALPTIKKALSGHTDGTPHPLGSIIPTCGKHTWQQVVHIPACGKYSAPSLEYYPYLRTALPAIIYRVETNGERGEGGGEEKTIKLMIYI